MSAVRAVLRLVAFSTALVWLAAVLSLRLRGVPDRERGLFRARYQHRSCRRLGSILGLKVEVHGTIDSGRSFLAVCNHMGILDGLILGSAFPLALVAKAEMRRWPVIGWVCRLVGIIFVDRDRPMEAGGFVDRVRRRIRSGVTVLVFPEGTVSEEDGVLPFRTGSFEAVADTEDLGVLPMVMIPLRAGPNVGEEARGAITWGRGESMLQHAVRVLGHRRTVVRVSVGAPIPAKGNDRKELATLSRNAVLRLRDEIRGGG